MKNRIVNVELGLDVNVDDMSAEQIVNIVKNHVSSAIKTVANYDREDAGIVRVRGIFVEFDD